MPAQKAPNAWQLLQLPPSPSATRLDRAGHTSTVIGTNICIAGGRRGSAFYDDVIVFDSKTRKLSQPVTTFPQSMPARAMHSATLIGNRTIWFIGGGDIGSIFEDVHTLDVFTWEWRVVEVNDPHGLLARTGHAAEVHPHYPSVILISGGFGFGPGSDDATVQNTITVFDTKSCSTELLVPHPSPVLPPPRCHHTMNVLGDRLYLFGGRGDDGRGGEDGQSGKRQKAHFVEQDVLGVFDLSTKTWLPLVAAGKAPCPRSSHRAVTLADRIIIYGGAVKGLQDAKDERVTDLHSLVVLPDGSLMWSSCDSPAPSKQMPQARSAHTLSLISDTMYVLCGYNGTPSSNGSRKYGTDAWALKLLPVAFQRTKQGAATTAAAQRAQQPGQQSHKRHAGPEAAPAPAAAAPALAPGNAAAPHAAAADSGSGPAAGDEAAWRTVKRQRSGGKGRQQQAQKGPDQQQQQQAQAGCQPQQQQQPQQQLQQQQMQQQQPQQQMQRQLVDAAVADAITAGIAQIMVGASGSRSPLRPGSPLRDSFGCAAYLQQEVDALRDKLQDSVRQTSTLEAEVRFLKQQLCEAKAEARQDKQASELKVQDCQMELARQATLLEQATVRSRRAAEEATVAQQDLSTAKQQLQRMELERDAAQQQLQGLHAELRKLRTQHAESEQEVRRLQLQVQQQQQQERRLQEQLARERQQQQEEAAATRASIEQHRIELRRLNDTMADQKQKYDSAVQQHQQEANAQQQRLQEMTQQLKEAQRQLEEVQAAADDAKKQRDDAVQLQVCTRDQYNALSTTYKAVVEAKTALESELAQLAHERDTTRRELEQRRSAAISLQSALQQMQAAMQQVVNASRQLQAGPAAR